MSLYKVHVFLEIDETYHVEAASEDEAFVIASDRAMEDATWSSAINEIEVIKND